MRAQGFTLFRRGLYGAITIIARSGAVWCQSGSVKDRFDALFDEEYRDIWLNIRLPRVLLAVLVGAALATAGVIMQGLFRNPMADHGLLGVSSGSALMVGVAIVLPFSFPVVLVLYEQMVFAIAGSLVVCTIIFLITQRHRDGSMMQLLLAGIAINAPVAQRSAS